MKFLLFFGILLLSACASETSDEGDNTLPIGENGPIIDSGKMDPDVGGEEVPEGIAGTMPNVTGVGVSGNPSNTLTLESVALHNSKDDCWVIINDKVYDLTSEINGHPGGEEAIIKNCGKDGTQDFTTRNGGGPHPQGAQNQLETNLIGSLE